MLDFKKIIYYPK